MPRLTLHPMEVITTLNAAELKGFPWFEKLEAAKLEKFLVDHRVMRVAAGSPLVFQGDWSEGLFLIRSGVVKVRHITDAGEEVVVALMGVGDMFGELAMLFGHGRRAADVISLTPLEVIKLRPNPIQLELERDPLFALELAKIQAKRLLRLSKRFLLRGEDATTRVLATLQDLALCMSNQTDPQSWIPHLSQSELAVIAGLARGTTSKVISQLRSRGTLTDLSKGFKISNLDALRKRGLLDDI